MPALKKKRVVEFPREGVHDTPLELSELQVETRKSGRLTRVSGYAAIFDTPYRPWADDPTRMEIVRRGAFTRSLEQREVEGNWDHGMAGFWGSTAKESGNGSLRVWEDERGLRYEGVPNPDNGVNRDWIGHIRDGLVWGSSFAFRALNAPVSVRDEVTVRELREVDLHDVSAVRHPASTAAAVTLRQARRTQSLLEDLAAAGLTREEQRAMLERDLATLGAHGPTPRRDAARARIREITLAHID